MTVLVSDNMFGVFFTVIHPQKSHFSDLNDTESSYFDIGHLVQEQACHSVCDSETKEWTGTVRVKGT